MYKGHNIEKDQYRSSSWQFNAIDIITIVAMIDTVVLLMRKIHRKYVKRPL